MESPARDGRREREWIAALGRTAAGGARHRGRLEQARGQKREGTRALRARILLLSRLGSSDICACSVARDLSGFSCPQDARGAKADARSSPDYRGGARLEED